MIVETAWGEKVDSPNDVMTAHLRINVGGEVIENRFAIMNDDISVFKLEELLSDIVYELTDIEKTRTKDTQWFWCKKKIS